METKKIFIDDEYNYELRIYSKNGMDYYELWYSSSPVWTNPDTLIFSLIDDGSFKVKINPIPNMDLSTRDLILDIHEISELKILFDAYEKKNGFSIYKTYIEEEPKL